MLEFGCGSTFRLTRLLEGRFEHYFGTDLDVVPEESIPPGVSFKPCTTTSIPYDDAMFDVVVIRSVMEHVEDPARTFAELARVTKVGGEVLMNLPNKWDYVSVIARLSGPLKSKLLRVTRRPKWEDFPVVYRCNTKASLSRHAAVSGFVIEEFLPLPTQPSYLAFFVPFYVAGAVYQFLVSLLLLDVLQPSFVVRLKRVA